jgi:hypothetical protein
MEQIQELPNITLQLPDGLYRQQYIYVTQQIHAIDLYTAIIAFLGFAIISYFWIKVKQNKPHYEKWVNPKGRVVNLYKIIKCLIIIYPITIIILGTLQIILFKMGLK